MRPRETGAFFLVLHHGGAGTLLGGLAQGLPALVLAEGADRPYTAESLRQSGAGLVLEPRAASSGDIAAALKTLFSDEAYRTKAMGLAKEIGNMPSPAEVVLRLESVVR